MKTPILLDGGMGQELIKRSGKKPTPLWATENMLDDPSSVRTLHADFIRAGASVITLNTYTATPGRIIRDHGDKTLFEKAQNIAIAMATEARDNTTSMSSDPVKIAGCLPPLRASYQSDSAPDERICLEEYTRIVQLQVDHVDLFLIETMSNLTEATQAITVAASTNKPVWISFVPKEITTPKQAALRNNQPLEKLNDLICNWAPEAVLLNCASPETLSLTLPRLMSSLTSCGFKSQFGAYANRFTSVEALKPGGTVEALKVRPDPNPQQYADICYQWWLSGCSIIGGCCEIGPEYILAIKEKFSHDHQ